MPMFDPKDLAAAAAATGPSPDGGDPGGPVPGGDMCPACGASASKILAASGGGQPPPDTDMDMQ